MEFAEVIGQVVRRTKRPDKAALVRDSINKAIVEFVRMKKFRRDLQFLEWEIPAPQTSDLIHLLPWSVFTGTPRAFEEIRGVNSARTLVEIKSNETLVQGRPRKGVYYLASAGVYVSLPFPAPTPPLLVENTDTNWVLAAVPTEIADRAAAIVFKSVGEDREADRLMSMSMLSYERAMRDID
jgi:hypothetical protein